jgi:hypothetical protein
MYIITARRITSGELLKYQKGLRTLKGYGITCPRLKPICSDKAYLSVYQWSIWLV